MYQITGGTDNMAFISLFEVIGPNMVGPSSSHTAGAVSMALLARKLFPGKIKEVHFTLYGSFAKTYRGHGTDRALMGGMLGFETDDLRIRDSLALAKKAGIDYTFTISEETDGIHPNTADMDILGGRRKSKDRKAEQYFRGFYRRIQYPYRQPDRQAGSSGSYYKSLK